MFTWRAKLLYLMGFVAFIFIGPLAMIFLARLYPLTFLSQSVTNAYLGALTSAIGLAFACWANYELIVVGRGGAGNFGKIKLMPETKHLVTSGPYSICRNPMHLGVFLYYAGISCALNSLTSLVVPLAVALVAYMMAIFIDEPRLERDFPDEFSIYKAQVPRFIPKILKRKV